MLPKKRKFFPSELENYNYANSSDQQEAPSNEDNNHGEGNNEAEMEDVGIDLSCKTRSSPEKEVVTAFRKVSNDPSASTPSTSAGHSSSVIYETR